MNNRDNIPVPGKQLFNEFISFHTMGMMKAEAVSVSQGWDCECPEVCGYTSEGLTSWDGNGESTATAALLAWMFILSFSQCLKGTVETRQHSSRGSIGAAGNGNTEGWRTRSERSLRALAKTVIVGGTPQLRDKAMGHYGRWAGAQGWKLTFLKFSAS